MVLNLKNDTEGFVSMSNDTIKKAPRAIEEGVIKIGNIEIECAVLDNGMQVITRTSMLKLMGRSNSGGRPSKDRLELEKNGTQQIPIFVSANNLIPFIPSSLMQCATPIIFTPKKGGRGYGFQASMIPDICETYLNARKHGNLNGKQILKKNQLPIADTLEIIMIGLAKVGISALVLEACGIPSTQKDYFQSILNQYIEKKLQPWVKRFPKSFFDSYKKLYGIEKEGKIPMHIGHFINSLIYKELGTCILDELRKINPIINGKRKYSHHRFLTQHTGVLELEKQLSRVHAIMCISNDRKDFDSNYLKIIEVKDE